MKHYQIFDLALPSEIDLPELPIVQESSANETNPVIAPVRVLAGWPDSVDSAAFRTVISWKHAAGEPFCQLFAQGDRYILRFEGYAEYLLTGDGCIYQRCTSQCSAQLARHFLINQAVPRALYAAGELILHASAISFGDKGAMAFMGHSGWGKSTLALALYQAGASLLSDDALLLRVSDAGVTVSGAYPGVRLNSEATQNLKASFETGKQPAPEFGPVSSYSGKRQSFIDSPQSGDSVPLLALVALNDPDRGASDSKLEPSTGSGALMALMQNFLVLDPSLSSGSVRVLEEGGKILGSGVTSLNLDFPRDKRLLPEVSALIFDWLNLSSAVPSRK